MRAVLSQITHYDWLVSAGIIINIVEFSYGYVYFGSVMSNSAQWVTTLIDYYQTVRFLVIPQIRKQ